MDCVKRLTLIELPHLEKFSWNVGWFGSPTMTTVDQRLSSPIFQLSGLWDLLGAAKFGHILMREGDLYANPRRATGVLLVEAAVLE